MLSRKMLKGNVLNCVSIMGTDQRRWRGDFIPVHVEEELPILKHFSEVIPREWDQQSQHFIFGNWTLIDYYCDVYRVNKKEDENEGYILFIEDFHTAVKTADELFRNCLHVFDLPKLTLHFLPGWQKDVFTYPWDTFTNDQIISDNQGVTHLRHLWRTSNQVLEALTTWAAFTHLSFGTEVDLATGFPAILDPPKMPAHYSPCYNSDYLDYSRVSAQSREAFRG
jgi:hypothetical protein